MEKRDPMLGASIEGIEAYAATGVQPTNLDHALVAYNAFLDDDTKRVCRGGGCLLCHFESWYYESLTGHEASQKLREEHHQSNPTCPGQFISYGGDPAGDEMEQRTGTGDL